jgi:hypothetical protein
MGGVSFVAILPKPFQTDKVMDELKKGVRDFQKRIRTDFEETVDTWADKPHFVLHNLEVSDKAIVGGVGTKHKVYLFVSGGTKPHTIRPKNAKLLVFFPGFTPKTQPRSLVSGPGSGQHDIPAFAKEVHHPGTEAREYPKQIARLRGADFKRRMQEAMKNAARASGHGG